MATQPYDCAECQAYCCSYPIIEVKRKDSKLLARHLDLQQDAFLERYTRQEKHEGKKVRILRHTADRSLGATSCIFLDKQTRRCTVYGARPRICRDHPGDEARCEWYDRMILERKGRRRVIRLKQMPTTISGDREQYDADRLPELFDSYARGDGIWPPEE